MEQVVQAKKDSLKVQALTQRVSQLVANYEEQLADVRAEATLLIGEYEAEIERLRQKIAESEAQVEVPQEADASEQG